jgi:hypothetical protein
MLLFFSIARFYLPVKYIFVNTLFVYIWFGKNVIWRNCQLALNIAKNDAV